MSTTDIDSLIERHREEVDAEIDKLRPAAEEFERLMTYREGMGKAPSARRTTRTRRTTSGGGGGGSNADRPQQFLEALKDKPDGLSIPEVAAEVGDVSPNYLYRVRDGLVEDGMVEKKGSKHILTKKGSDALAAKAGATA